MNPLSAASLFFLVLLYALPLFAQEEERADVPKDPILRIETGMHTAIINRIGVDAAQRFLVTASQDKTVRVWDLKTQRLLRTLRPPIGLHEDGKLFSVAISPDGKTVVCGGWTGYDWDGKNCIYVFDRETGNLVRRITGVEGVINHLTFSRDGRYLAATLGGGFGLRVYSAANYSLVARDADYGGSSYGADFDASGRLVTSCEDGFIRLYDEQLKLKGKARLKSGKDPFQVAFSPDGKVVAVGFNDAACVEIVSPALLNTGITGLNITVGKPEGDFILSAVAWSADGKTLYAAGTLSNADSRKLIRVWRNENSATIKEWLTESSNVITQLLPRKEGGIIFSAGDPCFGALDAAGNKVFHKGALNPDFRGMHQSFRVSETGAIVNFSYAYNAKKIASFFVNERAIDQYDPKATGMYAPLTEGLPIADWRGYEPKWRGKPIALKSYERSLSLAIAPDKKSFLLGCDFSLRRYDASGKAVWQNSVPGAAWAVNVTQDNNLAVAAFGDGTIRWFRYDDGKELLAFFPANDGKRWIIWTPEGYYDASAGGESLIGWHLNQGKAKESLFFSVGRFRNKFYRPDVIAKVLETLDVENALIAADEERGMSKSQSEASRQNFKLNEALPPVVSILSPENGAEVSSSQVLVRYAIESPSKEAIAAVKILVDGRPATSTRGLKKSLAQGVVEEQATVTIPERDCEISIVAENKFAASEPASVRVAWKGKAPAQDEFVVRPKLYALVIGVSQYQESSLQLNLAAKDAQDFAQALLAQKGGLYQDVVVKLLTDEQASKDNVLDGLEWLQKEVTSKDVGVVFFAGHGINDNNGTFYLMPVDANPEKIKRTCLEFSQFKTTIASLAGKVVVFLDACHSGSAMGGAQRRSAAADITLAVNELSSAENGAVVFSSSTGRQYSLEDAAWGNGAFTKALVEGLSGKADLTGKGRITVNMLDVFISERVKEITKGKQTPTTVKPPNVPDFPIAVKMKK
ncbi:MAG: caspase family protein [Chloroherpetonaceae bacterium]|nr:caspase family protein [Chloroherpetonaceae bacterium]